MLAGGTLSALLVTAVVMADTFIAGLAVVAGAILLLSFIFRKRLMAMIDRIYEKIQ